LGSAGEVKGGLPGTLELLRLNRWRGAAERAERGPCPRVLAWTIAIQTAVLRKVPTYLDDNSDPEAVSAAPAPTCDRRFRGNFAFGGVSDNKRSKRSALRRVIHAAAIPGSEAAR
jgi:hypothetical protein